MIFDACAVIGVPQLVCQGGDGAEGAVKIRQDPALLDDGQVGAESSAYFVLSGVEVDPLVFVGAVDYCAIGGCSFSKDETNISGIFDGVAARQFTVGANISAQCRLSCPKYCLGFIVATKYPSSQ